MNDEGPGRRRGRGANEPTSGGAGETGWGVPKGGGQVAGGGGGGGGSADRVMAPRMLERHAAVANCYNACLQTC